MKNLIKCNSCGWFVIIQQEKEIKENNIIEIKNNCSSCKKTRKFFCKKCENMVKMFKMS